MRMRIRGTRTKANREGGKLMVDNHIENNWTFDIGWDSLLDEPEHILFSVHHNMSRDSKSIWNLRKIHIPHKSLSWRRVMCMCVSVGNKNVFISFYFIFVAVTFALRVNMWSKHVKWKENRNTLTLTHKSIDLLFF